MNKPKWPRESHTKKVEEYDVHTDRGIIPCRTYRQRPEEYGALSHWLGVALIDEIPLRACSKDRESIDAFETRFRKLVQEGTKLDWRPYLYVQTGNDGVSRSLEQAKINSSISLLVQVCEVELAGVDGGEKFHRWGRHDWRGREGWPDVGDNMHESWDGEIKEKMKALVPDTQVNRNAIDVLRQGMDKLRAQLMHAFSPDNIELALTNSARLLGAGASEEGGG